YLHNLTRARLGTLPFFIVAILVVATWTRALAGEAAAIAAAVLFSSEPSVLAHAGLATTDMAATASTITAAYVFWRWIRGTGSHPVLLGASLAFAVLSKFSAILFVPAAMAAIVLVRVGAPAPGRAAEGGSAHTRSFAIALGLAALLVCAGYHFDLAPLWHGLLALRLHSTFGHLSY